MQEQDEVKVKGKYNAKEAYSQIIRDLTQKGCIITENTPITKEIKVPVPLDKEELARQFTKWMNKPENNISLSPMGESTNISIDAKYETFKQTFPNLFKTQIKSETYIEQPAFTINIKNAVSLGNSSWGKIGFLTKYKGFTLIK